MRQIIASNIFLTLYLRDYIFFLRYYLLTQFVQT